MTFYSLCFSPSCDSTRTWLEFFHRLVIRLREFYSFIFLLVLPNTRYFWLAVWMFVVFGFFTCYLDMHVLVSIGDTLPIKCIDQKLHFPTTFSPLCVCTLAELHGSLVYYRPSSRRTAIQDSGEPRCSLELVHVIVSAIVVSKYKQGVPKVITKITKIEKFSSLRRTGNFIYTFHFVLLQLIPIFINFRSVRYLKATNCSSMCLLCLDIQKLSNKMEK